MGRRETEYETEYRLLGSDPRNAQPHFSREVELIQTWSDGGYFIVNHHIFPIKPGSVFLIDAENLHYSNPSHPGRYNRSKVILPAALFRALTQLCGLEEFVAGTIGSAGGAAWEFAPDSAEALSIDRCFAQIRSTRGEENAQLTLISGIARILEHLTRAPREGDYPRGQSTIHRMARLINERLEPYARVTMEELSSQLHISTSRGFHLFRQLTGKTLCQYLTEMKMAEAKKLLTTTHLRVCEISESLGFREPTVFCRYFKKETGKTPLEYRRELEPPQVAP